MADAGIHDVRERLFIDATATVAYGLRLGQLGRQRPLRALPAGC
ncbi:hypothetical protein [Pseudofrankia inefficax]|nr:hypothetical protein [Pseudofrankia inefficax]